MTDVSIIGLGAMGLALANALTGPFSVTVWNRSPGKAGDLLAKGAKQVDTVTEAVSASPLVVLCLSTYDAVQDVLEEARGALAGRAVVNLTSGTPDRGRATAKWVADQGADYLCGGILAVPFMIGGPGAMILYSGSADVFGRHQGVFEKWGRATYLHEDPARALIFDIALLTGMYGIFAGALQAIALVRAEKIAAKELLPFLVPWLTAMTGSLPGFAEQADSQNYNMKSASSLKMQAEGFHHLIGASEAHGISTELVAPIGRLMDRGVAQGYGSADFCSLVELLLDRKAAAKPVTV